MFFNSSVRDFPDGFSVFDLFFDLRFFWAIPSGVAKSTNANSNSQGDRAKLFMSLEVSV
jgi:hypothetical protein